MGIPTLVLLLVGNRRAARAIHPRFDEAFLGAYRDMGLVKPGPDARLATEDGRAIAQQFGVPFHFPSPVKPDDQAPRWWDVAGT